MWTVIQVLAEWCCHFGWYPDRSVAAWASEEEMLVLRLMRKTLRWSARQVSGRFFPLRGLVRLSEKEDRELIVERRGEWVSLVKNKECDLGRSRQTPSVRGVAEPRRDGPLALIQFFLVL